MKICILMSTYNGEKFLREQLDSLLAQTVPVEIYVRDDGSTDSTQNILDEYLKNDSLKWYTGENLRPAKSFWDLVQTAPQADYYAFCDQDDVWLPDKIERAIKMLTQVENQNQPLLYCSNVTVTDKYLNNISIFKASEPHTDFAYSLIYSLAPGCTFVFNELSRNEMIKYDMNTETEVIHDWLTHKIVAMLGKVVYDSEPSMFYRQHENNVIGAKQDSKIVAFLKKVKRIFGSFANIRSNCAKSLLTVYREQISDENLHILNMLANYKEDKKLKKEFLKTDIFSSSQKSYLKWAIRLNKV